MKFLIYIFVFALFFVRGCYLHMEQTLVLLVSFDGFRWDYIEKAHKRGISLPNFEYLIRNGVKANYSENVFITKTLPNHFTTVTGMFEESHGVVGNKMYDPFFGEYFDIKNKTQSHDPKWWNNGDEKGGPEPIWVTNQKATDELLKRRSGVMMWPGNTVEIHGEYPYHSVEYNESISNRSRIDQVVDWFVTEENPINLGLLYFSEPDRTGHKYGPDSNQLFEMIEALDGHLGYMFDKFQDHKLLDDIDIIVTSDHGMTNVIGHVDLSVSISSTHRYTSISSTDSYMQITPKSGWFSCFK